MCSQNFLKCKTADGQRRAPGRSPLQVISSPQPT
uniref:Uncharacterized protein n=1 Tax=Anguilla anguilla TaxID=7936 RepID=A0A0E9TTE0_ANGAN